MDDELKVFRDALPDLTRWLAMVANFDGICSRILMAPRMIDLCEC